MLCFRLRTTLLLAATCSLMTAVLSTKRAITCGTEGNVQRLSCDVGRISVQTAVYERGNAVICVKLRRGAMPLRPCSQVGIVDVVKESCDGKRECELNINIFHTSDPCYGITTYLDTTYTCVHSIHLVACEGTFAQLQCDQGQVISVNGADYGRSDQTTCIYQRPLNQIQNIYCSGPTPQVAKSCNGKNRCTIAARNSVFGDPCVGTYKYLKVAYTCDHPVTSPLT